MKQEQIDQWNDCVEKARMLIIGRKKARIMICELTLKACDIIHGGGGHWNDFENHNTVKKFAKEIEMHQKTLYNWIYIYKYVYSRLPKHLQDNFRWTYGRDITRSMNKDATDEDILKAYNDLLNRTDNQLIKDRINGYCDSIYHNIKKVSKINELIEIKHQMEYLLNKLQIKIDQTSS